MSKEEVYLSASRIKTFESCSWLYYCKYILKLPDKSNTGAMRGLICHLIFELLFNPRHKSHYDKIKKKNNVKASKSVNRLILKHAKKSGIDDKENLSLIYDMILVGLNTDFYPKDGTALSPEFEFKINGDGYKAKGFIDLPILGSDGTVTIRDYKSSKKKFAGEELTANVQAMLYSLVSKQLWPQFKPKVEFIFLRFPKSPVQRIEFTEDELSGFEYSLKFVYDKISNFSEKDACLNFAKNGNNRWMCQAGATWVCPFKNSMIYYSVFDEEDNLIKSVHTLAEAQKLKINDLFKIKKMEYSGCPAWR